ncbi:hypothetical protein HAX54_009031 [Datura stramonium]|uniref:Uncharacterized protein n=1 Tax=Datura stramonium TaxID=4076 RepID=A0ABS8WYH2_DATST|nr:hypothetical protein [Datura stramonium]
MDRGSKATFDIVPRMTLLVAKTDICSRTLIHHMKPDTETYNWVIQAYTRAESYDRVQDVAELLGMMVEDHKRLQPNVRTYA